MDKPLAQWNQLRLDNRSYMRGHCKQVGKFGKWFCWNIKEVKNTNTYLDNLILFAQPEFSWFRRLCIIVCSSMQ